MVLIHEAPSGIMADNADDQTILEDEMEMSFKNAAILLNPVEIPTIPIGDLMTPALVITIGGGIISIIPVRMEIAIILVIGVKVNEIMGNAIMGAEIMGEITKGARTIISMAIIIIMEIIIIIISKIIKTSSNLKIRTK